MILYFFMHACVMVVKNGFNVVQMDSSPKNENVVITYSPFCDFKPV